MNDINQLVSAQNINIPIIDFWISIGITIVLSAILMMLYRKYGRSLSNRDSFSVNFILLSATTMLVITIVKSSLALSLGLVGALSIVRFRTAIKEPEELTYLFLAIAIGLGMGANQRLITISGFFIIAMILVVRDFKKLPMETNNLHLIVSASGSEDGQLKNIVEILRKNCSVVNMTRFDEKDNLLEAAFLIEFDTFDQLETTRSLLQDMSGIQKVSFLESRGAS
jgi:hypothetical protein